MDNKLEFPVAKQTQTIYKSFAEEEAEEGHDQSLHKSPFTHRVSKHSDGLILIPVFRVVASVAVVVAHSPPHHIIITWWVKERPQSLLHMQIATYPYI